MDLSRRSFLGALAAAPLGRVLAGPPPAPWLGCALPESRAGFAQALAGRETTGVLVLPGAAGWDASIAARVRSGQLVIFESASGFTTAGAFQEQRAGLLWSGVLMFLDRPLLGFGPGGFAEALADYGPQITWLYDYLPTPHNAFVQMAAETGVVGLLAFSSFLAAGLAVAFRSARRAAAALFAVGLAILLPFVLWNPGAFVEDVIRFPLGIGRQRSAAGTPTLGSLLVRVAPSGRTLITVLLVAVVAAIALALLVMRPPRSMQGAAVRSAVVFLVAMALVPSGRIGYVVYPIELLAWAWLVRSRRLQPRPADANRVNSRALAA